MSYILALIGARSRSRGVVGKNIRRLGNHPLLAYSIAAAQKTQGITRIIVSTDSPEYAELARWYGAETPFLQPETISGDSSTDYDWISYAVNWITQNESTSPELIMHLRPTTPLRDPQVLQSALDSISRDNTALRSIHEMAESAHKCFELRDDKLVTLLGQLYIETANKPRQTYPTTYHANGYVDLLRPSLIRSSALLHGSYVKGFLTDPVVEVDTQQDFAYLGWQIQDDPRLVSRLFPQGNCNDFYS